MDKDKEQKVFTDKFRSSSFESEAKKSTLSKTSVGRDKPIDIEKLKESAKQGEASTANIREVPSDERGIEKEILGKKIVLAV